MVSAGFPHLPMARLPALLLASLLLAVPACQHRPQALPPSGPQYVTESQLALARHHLRQANKAKGATDAASHALVAAEIAWDLNWKTSTTRLHYANEASAHVYEQAVLRILSLADKSREIRSMVGKPIIVPGPRGSYAFTIDPRTIDALRDYPVLHPASDYPGRGGFQQRYVRPGVGVPMVGANDNAWVQSVFSSNPDDTFRRAAGYTAPRTALLLFDKPVPPGGLRNVTIAIVDPRKVQEERIGKRTLPVAADLTAPIMAAYPEFGNFWAAFRAVLHPDSWLGRSSIYALEVNDPGRIPVVLVHGLFSTPDMWKDVINDLNATPGIGDRFQFFVFTYPTGLSPAYTASILREKILLAQHRRSLPQGFVLIGHSMGGILSRLQATESGRVVWDESFGARADQAWRHSSPDDVVRESLVFAADRRVRRLIFLCVPHRGSPVADLSPVRYFSRLARMPLRMTDQIAGSPLRALGLIPARLPTSASGLSPESPVLRALDKLPVRAPCHTVVGNRGKPGPLAQSSDGVVPYWSSHLDAALSEVVVPAGHGGFAHPLAIQEMKRILLLDAKARPPLQPAGR